MKISIMQPYLFPYIGYWQLIEQSDLFILLDDVNYITRGWINRNRFLCNGSVRNFCFPVQHASQNRRIQDTRLLFDMEGRRNFLKTLGYAYRDAQYCDEILSLLAPVVLDPNPDVTSLVQKSILQIEQYLGMKTPVCRASSLRSPDHLKGEKGILELCKLVSATEYLNPAGGKQLYHSEAFASVNIRLSFTEPDNQALQQMLDEHWDLSVIDSMMRFSHERLRQALQCRLLSDGEGENEK